MNRHFAESVYILLMSVAVPLMMFAFKVLERDQIFLVFLVLFPFGIACRFAIPEIVRRLGRAAHYARVQ